MTAIAALPCPSETALPRRVGADTDDLFERFRQAVEARVGRRFVGLRIEVVGGVGVVLYGVADCFYAKQVAQHVAVSLTRLPVLANHIRVTLTRAGGDPARGSPAAGVRDVEPR